MYRKRAMRMPLVHSAVMALTLLFAVPVSAQVLYGIGYTGSDGLSTLYTINPATGAATSVGAIGFQRCGGMDFNGAGVAFATCERNDGSDTPVLIRIDLMSGAGTEVGPTGLSGSVGDISFRADGTLFAYDASNTPTHMLATLNSATGAGALVGDTGLSFAGGNAMGFSAGGTLFHSQFSGGPNPDLNTLNQTTGAATFVSQISPTTGRFAAMDAHPTTGVLYAVLKEGSSGAGPTSLATIDPVAGTDSIIGATVDDMDALAWQPVQVPAAQVPMLGALGMALLVTILAMVGVLAVRRW